MDGITSNGAFTGATLAEKLTKLNASQQSIESILLLHRFIPLCISFVVSTCLNSQFFNFLKARNHFYIIESLRPWQHLALSHWCIFHRKKAREIVKTWAKKFHDAPKEQRVPFLYLANDILQNSRRKGVEFVNEFWTLLPKALREVVDSRDESVKNAAYRLVWVADWTNFYSLHYDRTLHHVGIDVVIVMPAIYNGISSWICFKRLSQ